MRSAIVTDIHADRAAFEAVLADIATRQIDRLVFLGDYVGNGHDINWVLDKVQDLTLQGALTLRGNHDRTQPAVHISPAARKVIDQTVNRLTAPQKLFLAELPLSLRDGATLFVHASAHEPQNWHTVCDLASARQCLAASDAHFICVGHAHVPALFCQDDQGQMDICPIDIETEITLSPDRRWLAVVGPVSQQHNARAHNGRVRAQYCIYDSVAQSLRYVCLC
jgi:predicted phosphodiesterase